MKIICSKTMLNDAISTVQKAIASRSPKAILDGILIEAEDKLTLTGYDMETGIECEIETEIRERGSIVVNSKMFGDIVRKLPDEHVVLESDEELFFSIKSGKASFRIRGLDAGDYPKIPIVEDVKKVILPQHRLRQMIQQTIFAVSADENRPILNGISVNIVKDELELVALDGFRLAVRKEQNEGNSELLQFIVPTKAMTEVARIYDETDGEVKIYPSHNHILFDSGHIRLVSRLIQGDFMPYKNIVPTSARTRLKLNSKDMLEAIERASLVINVEHRRFPVTLTTPEDNVLVISAKTDLGAVEEEIAVEMTGENLDIDFNPKYFLDALRVIEDGEIYLEFAGVSAPCLIKPLEGESFLYLVLPLRR